MMSERLSTVRCLTIIRNRQRICTTLYFFPLRSKARLRVCPVPRRAISATRRPVAFGFHRAKLLDLTIIYLI